MNAILIEIHINTKLNRKSNNLFGWKKSKWKTFKESFNNNFYINEVSPEKGVAISNSTCHSVPIKELPSRKLRRN